MALSRREITMRYRHKKQAYVQSKKDVPCADCGIKYPHYVMDFDHVRGEKEFPLCEAANKAPSMARINAEIAKCDVVCSNCHRERTFQRKHSGFLKQKTPTR